MHNAARGTFAAWATDRRRRVLAGAENLARRAPDHVRSIVQVRKALPAGATAQVFSAHDREGLVDLIDCLAALIDRGLDSPPAREPYWTDTDATTLIVELSAGSAGWITIDGYQVSEQAATLQLAAGFVAWLSLLADEHGSDVKPSESDPATQPADDPTKVEAGEPNGAQPIVDA